MSSGGSSALLRSREDLVLENLALRQQLLALHAQRPRTRLTALHKLFWVCVENVLDWVEEASRLGYSPKRRELAWSRVSFVLDMDLKRLRHFLELYTQRIWISVSLTGLGEAAHASEREQNRDATRKIHYSSHYFLLRLGSLVARVVYCAQTVTAIRDKNVPTDIPALGAYLLVTRQREEWKPWRVAPIDTQNRACRSPNRCAKH